MNKPTRSGCMFFAGTLVVSCMLYLANQSIIAGGYHALAWIAPEIFNSRGGRQFIMFVGPVLLLFLEWWLIDTLLWRGGDESEAGEEQDDESLDD